MHRREVLRNCTALGAAGTVGLLAGCSVGGEQAESESDGSAPLEVGNFEYAENESGNLDVTVTVENPGESDGTGTLYVTVTAAEATTDGESDEDDTVATRESRDVTVPAGGETTVTLTFDVTIEQFRRNGSLDFDVRT